MVSLFTYVLPFQHPVDEADILSKLDRFFYSASQLIANGGAYGLVGVTIFAEKVFFKIQGIKGSNSSVAAVHIEKIKSLFSSSFAIKTDIGSWLKDNSANELPLIDFDFPYRLYPKGHRKKIRLSRNKKESELNREPIKEIQYTKKMLKEDIEKEIAQSPNKLEALKKIKALPKNHQFKVIFLLKCIPKTEWPLDNDIATAMFYSSECRRHIRLSCQSFKIGHLFNEVQSKVWEVFSQKIFSTLDSPDNFYKVHYTVVRLTARAFSQQIQGQPQSIFSLSELDNDGSELVENDQMFYKSGWVADSPEVYFEQEESDSQARELAAKLAKKISSRRER